MILSTVSSVALERSEMCCPKPRYSRSNTELPGARHRGRRLVDRVPLQRVRARVVLAEERRVDRQRDLALPVLFLVVELDLADLDEAEVERERVRDRDRLGVQVDRDHQPVQADRVEHVPRRRQLRGTAAREPDQEREDPADRRVAERDPHERALLLRVRGVLVVGSGDLLEDGGELLVVRLERVLDRQHDAVERDVAAHVTRVLRRSRGRRPRRSDRERADDAERQRARELQRPCDPAGERERLRRGVVRQRERRDRRFAELRRRRELPRRR